MNFCSDVCPNPESTQEGITQQREWLHRRTLAKEGCCAELQSFAQEISWRSPDKAHETAKPQGAKPGAFVGVPKRSPSSAIQALLASHALMFQTSAVSCEGVSVPDAPLSQTLLEQRASLLGAPGIATRSKDATRGSKRRASKKAAPPMRSWSPPMRGRMGVRGSRVLLVTSKGRKPTT